MKVQVFSLFLVISFLGINKVSSQSSKYLASLVDSLPNGIPVFVNLQAPKGYMALERVTVSKEGRSLFYGVRNGYDSISKAHIVKITYRNKKWSEPEVIFADSSGAPSFSRNGKVMYFQYDHPFFPKGIYSKKTESGWSKPIRFMESLKKSHYLQAPKKNSYYFSAGIKGNDKIQDIYHVTTRKSDTIFKKLDFNLKGDFIDFFVSRDESFLILIINKNQNPNYEFHQTSNLFISFRKDKNVWSKPINLGKNVNTVSPWNWGPYVTEDNKYLFFSSWPKKVGTYLIDFEPLLKKAKAKLN
ncbi:hypothetical protein [Seonamhaeicola sp.]|uniref:hypothetical protein n=1 Tax=Seonamhaeicola sp. TaxID=1912245 RepID=UPI00262CB029|nr:hypothetical protein [Seonamhaeicola sp.]